MFLVLTPQQQLGRATEVAEFVKHGSQEATIEIELERDPNRMRRNPILTRNIKRKDNKSSWLVNGQTSTKKAVIELARSFSIQIDNLCQFLPQDKVVEFAAMNPVDLLKSTQMAAAPPEMIDFHEDLKKLRARQKEMLGQNRGDREQLANLENRQEMQRGDVERMKQRAEIKRRIDWLERCRPIPKYTTASRQAKEARLRQKQLSAELKDLKAELAPALRRVNEKQQYEREVRAVKQQRKKELEDGEKKVVKASKKIDDLDDQMKECDNTYAAERKGAGSKREDQKRIEQSITRIKKQMEEEPEAFDPRALNEQIQQKVDRVREMEDKNHEINEQAHTLRAQGLRKKADAEELQKRLGSLETQSGQQENKLEKASHDTYEAWQWIKENQDKFQQHVYGPPMVECSLKNPRQADAVESLLQETDFLAITCQSHNDYLILQQKLNREKRLQGISFRTCSTPLDRFRNPLSAEQLRDLGLDDWAINQLNGPEPVLAMLCEGRHLHATAIGHREINDDQLKRIADSPISSAVAGKFSYRFSRRREYGAAGSSTAARNIQPAKVWTNQPIDMGAKAALQRQLNEHKSDLEDIRNEINRLNTDKKDLGAEARQVADEMEALRSNKEERQKALTAFKALPAKLAQQEEKLAMANENLNGVRQRLNEIVAEKDKILLAKSEMTIQYAAVVAELRMLQEQSLEADVMHIEAQSDFETLKARNEDINALLQRKQAEEKEAVDVAQKTTALGRELAIEVKKLADEGKELEEQGDLSLIKMLQEIGERKLSAEELEADIDSEKAKLEITQGGSEGMVREFERRAKEIEALRERVQDFRNGIQEVEGAIKEIRGKWEPPLDALVGRISEKFGESFRRIGCAGQVVVYKASSTDSNDENAGADGAEGGNGLDFANWAIHVSVKFREEEPLSLLDSHRQSGGERAVSTIFYLMALQSLSRAPFRVVDEINQGMDPRNERMVHGRMVDIACGEDGEGEGPGSQYFLITPKLLSGLKYRRGMRVLCIVSGENMPPAEGENKVDFGAWVEKARALGLSRKTERRIDSGVHLGSSFGPEGGTSDMRSERSRSQSRLTEVSA
jgi:structural maintenance of chromosomes protein 5